MSMERPFDNARRSMIGRTKAVIVFQAGVNPVGIVAEVVARISSKDCSERIVFLGPAKFEERCRKHLNSIVLPVIDLILKALDVKKKNYEISLVNLGAAASRDVGLEVSGFSADLPVLLAMLSASLQMGLRQDIVSTGHIASLDGDIVPVKSISAKLHAAVNTPGISAFVFPKLDRDRSLQVLSQMEYEATKECLQRYNANIKTFQVQGLNEAARAFMTDGAIVRSSLRGGFFDMEPRLLESQSPINRTITFVTEGNRKRFWDVLEDSLMDRNMEKAKSLIEIYVGFHVENKLYPEKFGEQLLRLVISLPPTILKFDDVFPLVPMKLYIKLTQNAKDSDHEDIRKLFKGAFGESFSSPYIARTGETIHIREENGEDNLLARLLTELSEETLARTVGKPLDEARASYAMEKVSVRNSFEFNESISAFYAHVFRHIESPKGHLDGTALSAESIDLARRAFENKGGYKGALAEGIYSTNGGLRCVFDAMIERLKKEQKEKHIARLLKHAIDPLDWDAKVSLMKNFLERIGPELPDDLQDFPPKRIASHWETIVEHYAGMKTEVSNLLRRL